MILIHLLCLMHPFVENGRVCLPMDMDGNCFFRGISDQLYRDSGRRHLEVRQQVLGYVANNQDEFLTQFTAILAAAADDDDEFDEFEDWNSYVSSMRRDGSWAGDIEVTAATRVYR